MECEQAFLLFRFRKLGCAARVAGAGLRLRSPGSINQQASKSEPERQRRSTSKPGVAKRTPGEFSEPRRTPKGFKTDRGSYCGTPLGYWVRSRICNPACAARHWALLWNAVGVVAATYSTTIWQFGNSWLSRSFSVENSCRRLRMRFRLVQS